MKLIVVPKSLHIFAPSEDKRQRRGATAERRTGVQQNLSESPICRFHLDGRFLFVNRIGIPISYIVLLTSNVKHLA